MASTDGNGESQQSGKTPTKPASFLSQEEIDSIKDAVSIVDVVESYGLEQFQRSADRSGAKAVCPFHDDTNPSLSIDENRKMYKCFSCGAGGDVFRFVREIKAVREGGPPMTFLQSINHVASTYGTGAITPEKLAALGQSTFPNRKGKPQMSAKEIAALEAKKKRIILCNFVAADYFSKSLTTVAFAGKARQNIRERGILPGTVKQFAIGFAPDCFFQRKRPRGEGSLVEHLKEAGFTREEIIDSGLAKPSTSKYSNKVETTNDKSPGGTNSTENDSDRYDDLLDRFRGRIMVPIFDKEGKTVLGFGGRILPSLDTNPNNPDFKAPKYLNSPETVIFHKKQELFGLHNAISALDGGRPKAGESSSEKAGSSHRSIIIVEGYMDAIALWNKGVRTVVASMGTALTHEQLASAAKALQPKTGTYISPAANCPNERLSGEPIR